ncbi:MAG: uracil phosphoribosyltransferase [Bacteroidetes bacterium]|jgi:uracil phosphoribosyltransferase|nr:uracil phosphoribosyltransferase [Bacteroidota bacterium]
MPSHVHVIRHPFVQRDVTILRDRRTSSPLFRSVLRRTATLMAYEVTKDLPVRRLPVRTPLEKTEGTAVKPAIVLVPILRAGLGMVGGFVEVIPDARVGHIGLYRDEETLQPVDYYFKVPKHLGKAFVIVLDPMLATGGSAAAAITFLKGKGARSIRFVSVVAAPHGVRTLRKAHPDVEIYTCALDRTLNDHGYILPGLGDAGDRIFGTE